jgi:DNA-binding GntR family transcriptional regulator
MNTALPVSTLDLSPEDKQPLAAQAYLALERMIVMLELDPGATYSEAAILSRLAFGRTPVREALQRLEWEGLAEIRPRAGIAIAPLNAADWVKVTETRFGPERLLVRAAAQGSVSGAHAALRDVGSAMQKAIVSENTMMFLRADKAFDTALAAASENPFAARFVAPLQTHSRRFWYRYQSDTGLTQAAERHIAVIHAILARDAGDAEAAMTALLDMVMAQARASVMR